MYRSVLRAAFVFSLIALAHLATALPAFADYYPY